MQNFASPASKFCHLIAGQKLVKTHFAASRGNIEPVHGPDARPLLEVEAPHEPGSAAIPAAGSSGVSPLGKRTRRDAL
jgi:hypothetical protein